MFRTVSLLLKPDHARELAVAARVGKIVLTLRSPDEQDTPDGEEEGVKLADILNGRADDVTGPTGPSYDDGSPTGPVNPLPLSHQPTSGPGVAWRMVVSGPTGAEQYEWTDLKQLPTKSATIPFESELPGSDVSSESGSGEGTDSTNGNNETPN